MRDLPIAEPIHRSALVISIDALSESRIRETLDPRSVPTLLEIFDGGACAASAVPAFPSATAAGHAALWTGAYGDVSGISANWQPRLPRDQNTLLNGVSGYLADGLRAEPIWITAARAGLRVAAHHPTQAPGAPHYRSVLSGEDNSLAGRWTEAQRLLSLGDVLIMNGYNRLLAPDGVVSEVISNPRSPDRWLGISDLSSGVEPLEISWTVGADSLHALLFGGDVYDRGLISNVRDVARGVRVIAAALETESPLNRPLARHFSDPLHGLVEGVPVSLRFRLFSLSPDGSAFRLFQTSAHEVQGSDQARTERYVREIGGWVGNASIGLLRAGAFGTPLSRGGDGTAEAHYLETAELLTLQYMRGVEWLQLALQPQLLLDYFPLADEIDHEFLGMVDRRFPGHDPQLAARAQHVRERGWQLVDLRVQHARNTVGVDSHNAMFISGDHGMRPAWRVFRPNVALRDAGLLQTDEAGAIDLTSTRALSLNGYWININSTDWKGGIVEPAQSGILMDRIEALLLGLRDSAGDPIVSRIWRSAEHPALGLGGPVGGDLYFDVQLGYSMSADLQGRVVSDSRPEGKHGYPSVDTDMHTALCMASISVDPRRIGVVRVIDLAPTVAEWLGIPSPPDARGRSLLEDLSGARNR
ncbi:hypothetical protein BH23GEM6_BH23GEM6_25280 [soil metagenome]